MCQVCNTPVCFPRAASRVLGNHAALWLPRLPPQVPSRRGAPGLPAAAGRSRRGAAKGCCSCAAAKRELSPADTPSCCAQQCTAAELYGWACYALVTAGQAKTCIIILQECEGLVAAGAGAGSICGRAGRLPGLRLRALLPAPRARAARLAGRAARRAPRAPLPRAARRLWHQQRAP